MLITNYDNEILVMKFDFVPLKMQWTDLGTRCGIACHDMQCHYALPAIGDRDRSTKQVHPRSFDLKNLEDQSELLLRCAILIV